MFLFIFQLAQELAVSAGSRDEGPFCYPGNNESGSRCIRVLVWILGWRCGSVWCMYQPHVSSINSAKTSSLFPESFVFLNPSSESFPSVAWLLGGSWHNLWASSKAGGPGVYSTEGRTIWWWGRRRPTQQPGWLDTGHDRSRRRRQRNKHRKRTIVHLVELKF